MSEVEKGLHKNESQETNSVTNVKEEFIDENNKKSKNS